MFGLFVLLKEDEIHKDKTISLHIAEPDPSDDNEQGSDASQGKSLQGTLCSAMHLWGKYTGIVSRTSPFLISSLFIWNKEPKLLKIKRIERIRKFCQGLLRVCFSKYTQVRTHARTHAHFHRQWQEYGTTFFYHVTYSFQVQW